MTFPAKSALLALLVAAAPAPARAEPVALKETGSTLMLPLFRIWADHYGKTHEGVTIATEGSGSRKGIEAAIEGSAQIGTSDAFMSSVEAQRHPDILNIALAISAQTVNYNLPGIAQSLKLDGPVLAGIYAGSIRAWDDRAIASLNPGVALPHHDIVPVHRAEGSGDTFVFTQYLTFTTGGEGGAEGDAFHQTVSFQPSSTWEKTVGYGTSVKWPEVAGALAAEGNGGVVEAIAKTPYAIGYVGVSFADAVAHAGLGTASMKSYAGQFLLPSARTIAAAAASLTPRTPDDERLSLVNAPGEGCYPLIAYEYAMVSRRQPSPAMAAALRAFLLWATAPDEANAQLLSEQHFIPLPAYIWVKSHDQIEAIR